MAIILLTNGKRHIVSAEQGVAIWRILNDERQPRNQTEADFCLKIDRLFLSRQSAPASYLEKFGDVLDEWTTPVHKPKKQIDYKVLQYKDL